jgi:hypothetical protein
MEGAEAMPRDDLSYWDQRLENWAMWLAGSDGGSSVSAIWSFVGSGGGRGEPRAVVLAGEAMDTNDLVRKLDGSLRDAVYAWYTMSGSIRDRATILGCHPDTFKARVEAAKCRLDELQQAKRAAAVRNKRILSPGAA